MEETRNSDREQWR